MKRLMVLAVLAACLGITTSTFAQGNKRGGGGGGGGIPAVDLNVEILDSLPVPPIWGIASDGLGSYNHGQSSVSAQFTTGGFFDFNSGGRVVNAIYSTVIESSSNSLPASDSMSGVTIKTHGGSDYLQSMSVGGDARCVQASVNLNLGAYTRTIGYNAGYGDLSRTVYVKVTHPDNDTWILESDSAGICPSTAGYGDSAARVRDHKTSGRKSPDIDYGVYKMPLSLILRRN